jgi:RNA-directed DNA polymerase
VKSALLRKTYSLTNLERAWRTIQQNGRFSKSEEVRAELQLFNEAASSNLRSIQHRLARGNFKFQKSKGIPIPKADGRGKPTGKFRPIVLAPVESRIVQRAVLEVLLGVSALQPFIRTKFSFGGLRALRRAGECSTEPEALAAVPAAIEASLNQIQDGARFFATADIRSFFTKIPRHTVRRIISDAVGDDEFLDLFDAAIGVELENMAALREKSELFPTEEVGVAQGNSLSPLLGNIVLAGFDQEMNEGDCACIRYIDDFIIFAPTEKAAKARLRKSVQLLAALGMDLSPEKSSQGASKIDDGFEFLGIQVCPGLIRPAAKAQRRLMDKVESILKEGTRAMVRLRDEKKIERDQSLLATLRRIDTTVSGWGKHYRFCNDNRAFENLDQRIWRCIIKYLGCYTEVRSGLDEKFLPLALGIGQLHQFERTPLAYPRSKGA